jgi:thiamine biosynthesis lipoprotein
MAAIARKARIQIERHARLMATDVSIQLAVAPEEREAAESAAAAAMAWLGEVDQRLSRFRPESDLSRLNADAGRWHDASEILYTCVARALAAARSSAGLFDPALLPQMEAWGYDRDFAEIAHREIGPAHPPTDARGGWQAIELDPERRRIRLPEGVRLDLGGIAKGWAADMALEQHCTGFTHALVNVGGDLRLRGCPQPGTAWSVGIRDPRTEVEAARALVGEAGSSSAWPDLAAITFSRGGLATSGAVRRWWLRDGVRTHHLLDPRTGAPAHVWTGEAETTDAAGDPLLATATALAPTAARAEVAAKVALLRGYPAALRAVESAWAAHGPFGPTDEVDSGVALLLVLATGELAISGNAQEWLAMWGTDGAPLYFSAGVGDGGVALRHLAAPGASSALREQHP